MKSLTFVAAICSLMGGCASAGILLDDSPINTRPLNIHNTGTINPASSYPITFVVYVDDAFTQEERAKIHQAGNDWEFDTNETAVIEFVWDYKLTTDQQKDSNDRAQIKVDAPVMIKASYKTVFGGTFIDCGWTMIDQFDLERIYIHTNNECAETSITFQNIVKHELGHHLGAGHSPQNDNNIMSPDVRPLTTTKLSAIDLDMFYMGLNNKYRSIR